MDFVAFSHYYASLIEPKVRDSESKTDRKLEARQQQLRHYSPWKVALLYDFCQNENRLQEISHLVESSSEDLRSYVKNLSCDDCYGPKFARDSCHDNTLSRDNLSRAGCPGDGISEETNSLDLVEYCLQLLDRYSLTASFLHKATSHKSLSGERAVNENLGSLNDVTSLDGDVTSPRRVVTSRDGSVTESSEVESPGISALSSDSYSPECLLQTFYVCPVIVFNCFGRIVKLLLNGCENVVVSRLRRIKNIGKCGNFLRALVQLSAGM